MYVSQKKNTISVNHPFLIEPKIYNLLLCYQGLVGNNLIVVCMTPPTKEAFDNGIMTCINNYIKKMTFI